MFHCFYLIKAIFIRDPHLLKWLTRCSKNGSALSKDTGKIRWFHNLIICIHKTFISVFKSDDLHII